jgi:hypothetical protein
MQIAIIDRPVTVSIVRVKPDIITGETDGHTATARASPEQATPTAPQSSTQDPAATQITRSDRRVRFPAQFNV